MFDLWVVVGVLDIESLDSSDLDKIVIGASKYGFTLALVQESIA